MVAVEAGFEKSLSHTSSRVYSKNVVVSVEQKEALWSIVLLKKKHSIFLPTVIDFTIIVLCS